MIRYFFLILSLSFYYILSAQNIVENPGFESYYGCPHEYTAIDRLFKLPGWFSPSKGTPDYFNGCSKGSVGVPVNFMGHQWARDGNGYVGIILTERPESVLSGRKAVNEREYVSTRLKKTLLKDSLYILSFFYAIAPNSTYSVNRLGICLTSKKPKCRRVFECNDPSIYIDTSYKDTVAGEWIQVIDTIRAIGTESYLIIGNFFPDNHLKFYNLDLSSHRKSLRETIKINKLAYYFIDMVELKRYTSACQ